MRVIPVRCLGSINLVWIADALSRGIDGVILIGCKRGDDYQCHYIRGSELAHTRLGNVQETLDRLALEPERVKVVELAHDECDRIPEVLDEFADDARRAGPEPVEGLLGQGRGDGLDSGSAPFSGLPPGARRAGRGHRGALLPVRHLLQRVRAVPGGGALPAAADAAGRSGGSPTGWPRDPAVWLCHQCNDCTVRCPRDARPGDVLQAVRSAGGRERWPSPGFLGRLVGQRAHDLAAAARPAPSLFWVALLAGTGLLHVPPADFHAYEQIVPHWLIYAVFFPVAGLGDPGRASSAAAGCWHALGSGVAAPRLVPRRALGRRRWTIATHKRFGELRTRPATAGSATWPSSGASSARRSPRGC